MIILYKKPIRKYFNTESFPPPQRNSQLIMVKRFVSSTNLRGYNGSSKTTCRSPLLDCREVCRCHTKSNTLLLQAEYSYTDFWLSWQITVDVHFALRSLHHADVGSVVDVLEIYTTSIFMTEVSRVRGYSCTYIGFGPTYPQREGWAGASSGIIGRVDRKLSNDYLWGHGMQPKDHQQLFPSSHPSKRSSSIMMSKRV